MRAITYSFTNCLHAYTPQCSSLTTLCSTSYAKHIHTSKSAPTHTALLPGHSGHAPVRHRDSCCHAAAPAAHVHKPHRHPAMAACMQQAISTSNAAKLLVPAQAMYSLLACRIDTPIQASTAQALAGHSMPAVTIATEAAAVAKLVKANPARALHLQHFA
ncbi:hypothetical protein COO60DRAFT_694195 [Scenedesmus sp. NREL 46B-D3]|nr:hypothetical protein COO60DRAFT_694195 [Scenedesmus sp. NREL 46B-D3]